MSGLENLTGRVAVVTGGASGIGKGVARRLVAAGCQVVIAGPDEGPLVESAEEIGAFWFRADVTDEASIRALADYVIDTCGRVDILINNAGVGPMAPIDELTVEDFRWVLEVNLFGVILGTKIFLPLLKANPDGGHLVNVSSMAGIITGPWMGAYAPSKFAVLALTEVLAGELAEEGSAVGASVLVPAQVNTDINKNAVNRPGNKDPEAESNNEKRLPPLRRLEPEDVGDMVVDAIRSGSLYIVTHPETLPMVQARHRSIEAAFSSIPSAYAV
ncbi:SDR family NAD(P)-dependent oxidoreductase [Pseudarthrobacter sp. lyk4-40-TYG-27]|uniref:SDR family NAD(P)-dependent oxidoreductase n=1 Tax=Pseudarthrobacter sp. lyk4-40-TYG-27 TaxID=3040305 RepID=UPI002556703E|nr:SDR family NAD(P)-dependent oxidoreductase [Pseudarthrobacter sp. lyk4-40-TYG-27]